MFGHEKSFQMGLPSTPGGGVPFIAPKYKKSLLLLHLGHNVSLIFGLKDRFWIRNCSCFGLGLFKAGGDDSILG